MSSLGPISTLERMALPTYQDLDFSNGDIPPGLVYTRSSNHGVWDKNGRYSVLSPDTPPITWVPALDSYALAIESTATNLFLVTEGKPHGISIPGSNKDTGILAPDGSRTAIRYTGSVTTAPTTPFVTTADCATVQLYVLKDSTDSSGLLLMLRNGTKAINYGTFYFHAATGTFTGSVTEGVTREVIKRGDWWEVNLSLSSSLISSGETVVLYTGRGTSAGSITPATLWYAQATAKPVASSLIIPGASAMVRSSFTAYAASELPDPENTDLALYVEGYSANHPGTTIGTILATLGTNATASNRVFSINSRVADIGWARRTSNGGSTQGSSLARPDGTYSTFRAMAYRMSGKSMDAVNGSTSVEINMQAFSGSFLRLGSYGPNNGTHYIKRATLFRERMNELAKNTSV